jgi:hypothetical protein
MQADILAPAMVLVLWTLVMLVWLAVVRIPAIGGAKGLAGAKPGGRGQDLENVLPPRANWPSHNYTHLVEQPTLFYATVAIAALVGHTHTDVLLAWAYVGIRIVHSLWQVLVNRLPLRFTLFLASTACLFALAVRVAMVCFA